MGKYQVILFDLDGTLINSEEGIIHSLKKSLKKFNVFENNISLLRQAIGPPLEDSFQRLFHLRPDQVPKAVEVFHQEYRTRGVHKFSVYADIPELLSTLYEMDYILAIATSKPVLFARQILLSARLDQYFQIIVGSGPDRDVDKSLIIREVLYEHLNLDRRKALMVGDTRYDILGAREHQIHCCAVTYGFGNQAELRDLKPEYLIDKPLELLKILL